MTKIASLQAIAAALLAFSLAAAPAQAGPNRTFVSGTGTDSGACSRTAPCRTFAFALGVTTAGGEIDVLDTAGYGPVTIIHAITSSTTASARPASQPDQAMPSRSMRGRATAFICAV